LEVAGPEDDSPKVGRGGVTPNLLQQSAMNQPRKI